MDGPAPQGLLCCPRRAETPLDEKTDWCDAMSKSKIKTREKGKDIKVLDKSAVVGQRMKSAFIRSKATPHK